MAHDHIATRAALSKRLLCGYPRQAHDTKNALTVALPKCLARVGIRDVKIVNTCSDISDDTVNGPVDIHGVPTVIVVLMRGEPLKTKGLQVLTANTKSMEADGNVVLVIEITTMSYTRTTESIRSTHCRFIRWPIQQLAAWPVLCSDRKFAVTPPSRQSAVEQKTPLPEVCIDSPEIKWLLITEPGSIVSCQELSAVSCTAAVVRRVTEKKLSADATKTRKS